MRHFAYHPKGEDVALEADYVVVGSGAGGSAVAVQLARGGADVVVVEAGPWRAPRDYPSSTWGCLRDMMDGFGMQIARGRALWPVVQASAVGGTTTINSAIVVRTPGDVFRQWEMVFGVGGDAMAEAVWRHQDTIEADLSVETVPRTTWGRTNALADAAARELGFHDHDMRRNVHDCAGHGQCMQGCRSGHKQSTNVNYIPEVLRRGGRLLSCAPVATIDLQGTQAVGVSGRFKHPQTHARGGRFTVRARKAVVVAASATHTPALLKRSGVRSPALGAYFRAHPGTGVFGLYDDAVNMNTGATQGWATTRFRESEGLKLETLSIPLELVASRLSGGGRQLVERLEDYPHLAMWVMAVRARAVGRVDTSFTGEPIVRYSFGRQDMVALRKGAHLVGQMHVAAGAKQLIPGIHGMPYSLRADEVDRLLEAPLDPQCWTVILSHLFGGAVMGADRSVSVCDGRGRVYGYQGLVVADAAAIPSTLGVNPQHTLMGLGMLRADELLAVA